MWNDGCTDEFCCCRGEEKEEVEKEDLEKWMKLKWHFSLVCLYSGLDRLSKLVCLYTVA